MYDPYSGKRKRGESPLQPASYRLNECGWCLILLVLALGTLLGVGLALLLSPEREATPVLVQASPVIFESTPILPTPTPIPPTLTPVPPTATRRPNTPTPTQRPFFETPSRTPTQPATATLAPSPTLSVESSFDFFARAANLPASLDITGVSCTPLSSRFTLLINHPAEKLAYLELTLIAENFTQIIPNIPRGAQLQKGFTFALNEDDPQSAAVFNLNVPADGAAFGEAFTRLLEELKPQDLRRLSLSWLGTEAQAALYFDIQAEGRVELQILWARTANDPLQESERLQFWVC